MTEEVPHAVTLMNGILAANRATYYRGSSKGTPADGGGAEQSRSGALAVTFFTP